MPKNTSPMPIGRRGLLLAGATGLGAAALLRAGTAAAAQTAVPLALTAQTTEGPYYFDPKRERADVTEGLGGVPLDVAFTVLTADGAPLAGARVDLWHCDAGGIYSGYAGQGDDRQTDATGKTFLRGHLPTGRDGVATFRTVYPGWYEGRTTHIHFKVIDGQRAILTSQFFLPDALSEFLYTAMPAYKRARLRGTLNSNDGIALMAGDSVLGAVRETRDRYVASLTLVVDRHATPAIDRPPGPPPGSGGRRPPPPDGFRGPPRGMREAATDGPGRVAALVPGNRTEIPR